MLTSQEYEELQYLYGRCEEGGNDGADVYECEEYSKMLELKYGLPIKDLEEAYLKENPKA
jgi:hypothetical protein